MILTAFPLICSTEGVISGQKITEKTISESTISGVTTTEKNKTELDVLSTKANQKSLVFDPPQVILCVISTIMAVIAASKYWI